jgi:hypothetical protein
MPTAARAVLAMLWNDLDTDIFTIGGEFFSSHRGSTLLQAKCLVHGDLVELKNKIQLIMPRHG